eukprot:6937291-Prymnesium_polylepis.2
MVVSRLRSRAAGPTGRRDADVDRAPLEQPATLARAYTTPRDLSLGDNQRTRMTTFGPLATLPLRPDSPARDDTPVRRHARPFV